MDKRLIVLVLAGLLSACGSTPSDTTTNEEPTQGFGALPVIALGTPGRASGFEVTVKSVELSSQIGTKGIGPATEAGETFVVVRYSIRNVATAPIDSVELPMGELIDGKDQTYSEDGGASVLAAALNDDLQSFNDLNPNVTANQTKVWKVDKASFDTSTWRLKVSFDKGLSARLDSLARWPLDPEAVPPLIFGLK